MQSNNCRLSVSSSNRVVVYGNELKLYEIQNRTPYHRNIIYDYQNIRQFTFNPHQDYSDFCAISNNGKVSICKFNEHQQLMTIKEFNAKGRNCNSLEWCNSDKSILLTGTERAAKADCGLIFWNIESALNDVRDKTPQILAQYGSNQAVSSACWLNSTPTAVAGMAYKWLRAYDLRDQNTNSIFTVDSKAVLGVCADPFQETRFASYADDGIIRIWDMRSPSTPLTSIPANFRLGISSLQWCPMKRNLIAANGKDSQVFRLWSIHGDVTDESIVHSNYREMLAEETNDTLDLSNLSTEPKRHGFIYASDPRSLKPTLSVINSFHWVHPSMCSQPAIFVCTGKDTHLDTFTVPEVPLCAWTPKGKLCTLVNGKLSFHDSHAESNSSLPRLDTEISEVMLQRTLNGYSLDMTSTNVIKEDPYLVSAWEFVQGLSLADLASRKTNLKSFEFSGVNYANLGLSDIVAATSNTTTSKVESDFGFPVVIYTSKLRDLALSLCGWDFSEAFNDSIDEQLAKLKFEGEFEKAAGLTFLYHISLSRTIECLNSSQNEKLMLVAGALAGGYSIREGTSQHSHWKAICRNLSFQLQDPYLRVLFGFLASDGNWQLVLNETTLPLSKRMLMALRFLNDADLNAYVKKWALKVIPLGRLDGMLLTGWSTAGLDLLENYIDRTGDVQTAALLLSCKSCTDPRAECWISTYRDLLDHWQLYRIRAKFDIARQQIQSSVFSVAPHVYVRCSFCNQSIAAGVKPKKTVFIPQTMNSGTKSKSISCPSCSNALPRCALCLVSLGTPLDSFDDAHGIKRN